jgi:SAM-dependent methyltransferase
MAVESMGVVRKMRGLSRRAWRRVARAIDRAVYGAPTLPAPLLRHEPDRATLTAATEALSVRWAKYSAVGVDQTISPHDDMFEGRHLEQYLFVGRSAIEVISEGMLLARKTHFGKLLDLPCGYGRVTRHLVKFFPDAEIFVSEIDRAKQDFCSSTFGVQGLDLPADFSGEPAHHFDLIFVGSLLTHLNEGLSIKALDYLLKSLSEGGLLIITTHGRYATTQTAARGHLEQQALRSFWRKGFGYEGGSTYGNSRIAPSWFLRALESMPDARVLGHKEQGWALFQDVFVIEKAIGWTWPRPLKMRWPYHWLAHPR